MKIDSPDFYYNVSLERIKQAKLLYDEGASYAFSMYAAGVAVECMLRAFKMRRDPTFDEKHDLLRLFKASGMLEVDPKLLHRKGLSDEQTEVYLREMHGAVSDIYELWDNDFRFASEDRLRAFLKRKHLGRDIRVEVRADRERLQPLPRPPLQADNEG